MEENSEGYDTAAVNIEARLTPENIDLVRQKQGLQEKFRLNRDTPE